MQIRMLFGWLTARLDVRSERGATAVEYGLMVALIAAVIIGIVFTLGGTLRDQFTRVNDCVATPTNACP
jgi:pilus assembly protein Flp/PilA